MLHKLLLSGCDGVCSLTETCPESYEYKECGSPCALTCDNYQNPPFCTAVCQSGCFCPSGTVEHNSQCISTEDCPTTTTRKLMAALEMNQNCTESLCLAVTSLCMHVSWPYFVAAILKSTLLFTAASCPDTYEYKECGSPCALTCDNYQNPPFCTAVCQSGCFCPSGTVEHNSQCISTEDCPTTTTRKLMAALEMNLRHSI